MLPCTMNCARTRSSDMMAKKHNECVFYMMRNHEC